MRLSFSATLLVDEDHQVIEDACVDVKEVYLHLVLLLALEKREDAGSHGANFLVDSDEISVSQVAPLAVLQGHLVYTSQHRRHQQVVRLVDLAEVDEGEERDVLENAVLLAEVTLLEQAEHILDQVVYHGQYLE